MHGFCFKKFTSIYDKLATEMNICIQKADIAEWMMKGKTTLIQKDTRKNRPKQLQNHNVLTDDIENTNSTN